MEGMWEVSHSKDFIVKKQYINIVDDGGGGGVLEAWLTFHDCFGSNRRKGK